MKRIALIAFCGLLFAGCKKDAPDVAPQQTAATSGTATTVTAMSVAATASVIPTGLPKHVAFGTDGDISRSSQFITQSDYQYQYLADDIFTGGWATWTLPAGSYASNYLTQTSKLGKIPVFTYYNIVPAKGRMEDPAFTNLEDPEVMNKYFNDFKLLLQMCKSYGKTVIIHYEPDLFGYMEMFKNDATKQTIQVAASGQADVKAFSNNAAGLAQAIVALRNKYAPNVLLAWHASHWATGMDLIKDQLNPESAGTEVAAYYKSLNAKFDLIFSEFSDRDEGYNQLVQNNPNTVWAATATLADGNLSDFDRFQRYLKTINTATGLKLMLWQIPIGNNQTQTCNNTAGHYKDNRAEYFFQNVLQSGDESRIQQYGQAGVIAFLFGPGINDCTSYMDRKADGITAPTELADDDGGYLRKCFKAYYQQGAVALN